MILILDPEEIKNPLNMTDEELAGFRTAISLVLAHAHEVKDLDEIANKWIDERAKCIVFGGELPNSFSLFLASKLDTQKQNVQEETG